MHEVITDGVLMRLMYCFSLSGRDINHHDIADVIAPKGQTEIGLSIYVKRACASFDLFMGRY